jgi:hypothetical protein
MHDHRMLSRRGRSAQRHGACTEEGIAGDHNPCRARQQPNLLGPCLLQQGDYRRRVSRIAHPTGGRYATPLAPSAAPHKQFALIDIESKEMRCDLLIRDWQERNRIAVGSESIGDIPIFSNLNNEYAHAAHELDR